jgi:hypothetical protein
MTVGRRRDLDRGAGLVLTMFGVPLVLVLCLFAGQLLLRLHATSTVRALAGDAVRHAAVTSGSSARATERATQVLRERLGPAGTAADINWITTEEEVGLRVSVDPPRILSLAGPGPMTDPIVASVSARRERWA